jgi:hypothetical protein
MKRTLKKGLYINLGLLITGNILALYRGDYAIGFLLTLISSGIFLGLIKLSKFIDKEEAE